MLEQRIQILTDGNVISPETAGFTLEVIRCLRKDYPSVTDEQATMFITHLAMAAQRILENKPETPIDGAIIAEVHQSPVFPEATAFLEKIMDLSPVAFSQTEKDFLIVHLCTLFS